MLLIEEICENTHQFHQSILDNAYKSIADFWNAEVHAQYLTILWRTFEDKQKTTMNSVQAVISFSCFSNVKSNYYLYTL